MYCAFKIQVQMHIALYMHDLMSEKFIHSFNHSFKMRQHGP